MGNEQSQAVIKHLDSLGIKYDLIEHAPAMTMEDLAEVDQKLGVPHAKNLFLCNRQKTAFYLLLMDGDKPFRTAELSRQIGSRLSFAGQEHMQDFLQTKPGALSPFGLIFDAGHKVQLLVDQELRRHDRLCFHPCANDTSLVLQADDFWHKFLKSAGHEPTWVLLSGEK